MSIKAKGRERSGLVLAAGTLLSSLGVVMVALVCCGVPVLTAAAGVFAAAGAMAGNLWFIAAAALTAVAAVLAAAALALRRRSKSKAQGNSAITDGAESSDSTEACCGPEHLLPDTAPGRTNQQGNP